MIIFSKSGKLTREQAEVIRTARAEDISITLDAGESMELNTPMGRLNVERTADTWDITDWEGMTCFRAEKSGRGVWSKEHPLTNEELERRRAEFERSERRANDKL